MVLAALDGVERFVSIQPEPESAAMCVDVAHQVGAQDIGLACDRPRLRHGVAKDRRISSRTRTCGTAASPGP